MADWARIGSAKVASHSPGPRLEVTMIEPARSSSGSSRGATAAATDDLAEELELARVVVERQPPVVEEPLERRALIARVADRLGERALAEHAVDQAVALREEPLDEPRAKRTSKAGTGSSNGYKISATTWSRPHWSQRRARKPRGRSRGASLARVAPRLLEPSLGLDHTRPPRRAGPS